MYYKIDTDLVLTGCFHIYFRNFDGNSMRNKRDDTYKEDFMNSKSRKIIGIIVLLFIITFATFFIYLKFFQKFTISDFFENEPSKITQIQITDGNNGDITIITDKTHIEKISQFLSTITLKKAKSQTSTGWLYNVKIINNSNQLINITLHGNYKINGQEYKVTSTSNTELHEIIDAILGK